MSNPEAIALELPDGRAINVLIRRRSVQESPHTARSLDELHGWVATDDPEVHRWMSVALRGVGETPVRSVDDEGERTGHWRVSWNSYGETEGVHTYGLILREAEDLRLECLILDSLELRPYEYREEILAGGLTISAKVVGSQADVTRIGRLIRSRPSFPVVRRGINDEPREMRLGVAEWSRYEDRIKYRLVLVDEEVTEERRAQLSWLQAQNDRAAFGYYANVVERLADLMVERSVITPAELDTVRDLARSEPGVARHEFWHVADVDVL